MAEDQEYSFFKSVLSLETEEECQAFFGNFLSERELVDMLKRWHVFVLLYQNLPQSQIKRLVGVSKYKVTRANKALKGKNNSFLLIMERLMKHGNRRGNKN